MGLAMSRSLGDDIAHKAGVSSEPEVMEHEIDANDQVKIYVNSRVREQRYTLAILCDV